MRLTGTLSKLRAKLTDEMLPAMNPEATLVKNWNVRGSIGAPAMRGSISAANSRTAAVRTASRGPIRKSLRTTPTSRTARWSNAPRIAPTAAA